MVAERTDTGGNAGVSPMIDAPPSLATRGLQWQESGFGQSHLHDRRGGDVLQQDKADDDNKKTYGVTGLDWADDEFKSVASDAPLPTLLSR